MSNQVKILAFWNWFFKKEENLFAFNESNADEVMEEMHAKIREVDESLSIEVSKIIDNKRQFEVSVNGDVEKFELVKEIVAMAPELSKWNIVAFRQPHSGGFVLRYQDLEFDTSKIFFEAYKEDGKLDLVIYGNNFGKYDQDDLQHYGFIMVDNILGEYDCVMKVRYYDFQDINDAQNVSELQNIEELPEFIEWFYSDQSN